MQKIVLLTGRLDCLTNEQIEQAIMKELKHKEIKVPEGEINVWVSDVNPLYQQIFDWQEKAGMYDGCNK
jgi:hypothetical protein